MKISTLSSEVRNSLHQTSTGIAHPHPGPPLTLTRKPKYKFFEPLPPPLVEPPSLRVSDVYTSSTELVHCPMRPPAPSAYRKAPGHWKVHYTADTIQKCNKKPWARPLTMAHQCSEMKAQYQGKSDPVVKTLPDVTQGQPVAQLLQDHLEGKRTKLLYPSTLNPAASGRPFVVNQKAVFDRRQPYVSTHQWFHQHFSPRELAGYPCKDVATYWQCEDYPKAWGHGMDYNPLDSEEKVMRETVVRDRTVFPQTTTPHIRPPRPMRPVTNGLQSLYQDSFASPPPHHTRTLFTSPVPPTTSITKDKSLMLAVPHMYQSMSMMYGSSPGDHPSRPLANCTV